MCAEGPGVSAYSGFSNEVTVDTGSGTAGDGNAGLTLNGMAERLAGDDRNGTAAAISKNGWEKSESVVLTGGGEFSGRPGGVKFRLPERFPGLTYPFRDTEQRYPGGNHMAGSGDGLHPEKL